MGEKRAEELVGDTPARVLRWWGIGLRVAAALGVFLVIWTIGIQQRGEKEKVIKTVEYIGHSDEAAYASGGVSLAEGRGLTVPYVSYFFNAYEPWGPGVWRREDHWPPFMDFAIAPCVYLWGKEAWVCKLPAIFFGSIGLPLTTALLAYALSRRGYVAIVAGLIMMGNSLIYSESLKTLSDISTGMMVTGFGACVVLAQRKPWMHILAGAFLAGAYFSKGSQLVLLGLYPVMAILCTGPSAMLRKSFWAGMGTAVFLMAPYWYGNWKTYGYVFQSTQNYVSGWYAVDDDWEERAYFPYWGKNLPKTSDMWTPLPARQADGQPWPEEVQTRAGYSQLFWRKGATKRLSYLTYALGGSSWQDFGNLGLWWRDAINQMPVNWIDWWKDFKVKDSAKAFFDGSAASASSPAPSGGGADTPPNPAFSWKGISWLFQRATFNVPELTRQVNVPFFTDWLRRWSKPVPKSGQAEAPLPPAPPETPPATWPLARLAGIGTLWLVSISALALPVVIVAGSAKWLGRIYTKFARMSADPLRAPRKPLDPVWFPGPVLAVALLLAMEVGFIAYLWAIWESRFYIPFLPLGMALGCAAFSLLFEAPILLLIAAVRGIVSAAVWPLKTGRTVRAWQRVIFTALSHWHALLTILVALAILVAEPQVFARVQQLANASGAGTIEDRQTPAMGRWIAKNLPHAVILCRNPWELLFYCGETNRGVALPNPGRDDTSDARIILAIARYYHVTHYFMDSIRQFPRGYISAHPEVFKPVPGAPQTIYEINWDAVPMQSVEEALGRAP